MAQGGAKVSRGHGVEGFGMCIARASRFPSAGMCRSISIDQYLLRARAWVWLTKRTILRETWMVRCFSLGWIAACAGRGWEIAWKSSMSPKAPKSVRRMDTSWDAAMPVIPNRCLSVSRCVGPRSLFWWREGDLPPPRAPEMCGSHPAAATAAMGRFDRHRRRRECAKKASTQIRNVPLDSHRFIDAQRARGRDSKVHRQRE